MIKAFYYLQKIRKNLYKDIDVLKKEQFTKIKKILIHAYETTEYYKELFNEIAFDPYTFSNVKELQKIPFLTKEKIQKNYAKLISNKFNKNRLIIHQTSGSTGIPLKIYNDPDCEAYNVALRYRSFFENGQLFTDKILEITSPDYLKIKETFFQKMGFLKKYRLSIFDDEKKIIRRMNKIKPNIILSYPSVLYLISKVISRKKLKFKPKIIFTSSELITQEMKESISNTFGCPVIDLYGSEEFNRLAWECEKQEGYHLDIDLHHIEFVDEDNNIVNKGEGEFIVTSLVNYAFPYIRYKAGDVGKLTKKKCICGRTFPLVKQIQGREDDYIKLPSGRIISPRRINIIEEIPGIQHYQTIQLKKNLFQVNVVKDDNFSHDTINQVKHQIKLGCYGENVQVNVKLVDKIKREKSGKIRAVISQVK